MALGFTKAAAKAIAAVIAKLHGPMFSKREAVVIDTADSYTPAVGAAWTLGIPPNQDSALDQLAARVRAEELSALSLRVKRAIRHVTVGGAAAEVIAVAGVVAGDVVVASKVLGPQEIVSVAAGAGTVTVTFDADPLAVNEISLLIFPAI